MEGLEVYHPENLGRNKVVTVLASEPVADFGEEVQIEPVNLQNLFYAMCADGRKEA